MYNYKNPYNPEEYNTTEYMQSRKKSQFSGPIVFVLVVIAVIFVMSVAFRIENISVQGNEHYTAQEIINAIDIEEGDNLFFFDRFAAISRVFAKLPYVEEVNVTRLLPNKVIIEVRESKALAYIQIGTELWTFDHDCKILGKAAEGEEGTLIPVIGFKPGTLYIGECLTSSDGSDRAVNVLQAVLNQIQDRNMAAETKKIDFTDVNNVNIYYGSKYIFKIGDPYETEHKFGMLVSAMSQLKDGDIGSIDVSDNINAVFTPR